MKAPIGLPIEQSFPDASLKDNNMNVYQNPSHGINDQTI